MNKRSTIHHLIDLSPEHALDEMVCHLAALLGGCGTQDPPTTTPAPAIAPVIVINGQVAQDAFHFTVQIDGPDSHQVVPFILDTGAFEMLLMKDVADALNLPNEGNLQIQGVTGSAEAYQSTVSVSAPDASGTLHTFTQIPCVVDPSATGNLFGFRFFQVANLAVAVNPDTQRMGWYTPQDLAI